MPFHVEHRAMSALPLVSVLAPVAYGPHTVCGTGTVYWHRLLVWCMGTGYRFYARGY